MSSHFTRAARTTFTNTNVMTTCGWSSRLSSKWPSSAVIPTTSSILGTISISAFFGCTKMASPAKIEHFLKFNSNGPNDRELIFVSGSPGKTDRQLTLAEMADMRDRYLPYVLNMFYRREVLGIGLQRAFIRERT